MLIYFMRYSKAQMFNFNIIKLIYQEVNSVNQINVGYNILNQLCCVNIFISFCFMFTQIASHTIIALPSLLFCSLSFSLLSLSLSLCPPFPSLSLPLPSCLLSTFRVYQQLIRYRFRYRRKVRTRTWEQGLLELNLSPATCWLSKLRKVS